MLAHDNDVVTDWEASVPYLLDGQMAEVRLSCYFYYTPHILPVKMKTGSAHREDEGWDEAVAAGNVLGA
jgi:hypothetical protein